MSEIEHQDSEVPVAVPIPVIRGDLSEDEFAALVKALVRGMGEQNLTVSFSGQVSTFKRLVHTEVPAEYLEPG